ncbi:SDR family oxidoreductase [Halobacterium noricense]|uniref:SDR family oxidoreductase n=1 Tax=Halobacterium noricense TaxID=223182 RepID=UPI001E41C22E|nr:SDR family oxidoreductase [Halobacterium noricense]UHH24023.1 SDR family oxidoreductase [Halobacterium noricense]
MDLGLSEKRAFVLAASQGLGKAVATELVRDGASVIIASRNTDRLTTAVKEIRQETGCEADAIDYVVCDLDDEDGIRTASREAIDQLGGLDILVTNHGGPQTSRFPDLSIEEFDNGYQSVLRSTIIACEECLPELQKAEGTITNLVAASALEPSASGVIGNVFRPGIYGLSKVLAEEYGDDGIRVNCVAPRGVTSNRIEEKIEALAEREGITETQALERRTDELALDELGQPEEFARTAVYVASPAADYLTGAVIPIDGGWHRHAF